MNGNSITIEDVAKAINVSKTTVSRAISGKGRISEQTRAKVLKYIDEKKYIPNPMAKGLAQSKTWNLCWAVPSDSSLTDLPFFQSCMVGVAGVAAENDYDILISLISQTSSKSLQRIVTNKKVDGVILGRTLVKDECIKFLKKSGVPFVVIGGTDEKNVIQIDNDHVNACRELTELLIENGIKKIGLIGGSMDHVVNRSRASGYYEAIKKYGIDEKKHLEFFGNDEKDQVAEAVHKCIKEKTDCIVCMDDRICMNALETLKNEGIEVPAQIKVAAFYHSSLIENASVSVTSLSYDPKELGTKACHTIIDMLEGVEVKNRTVLGYRLLHGESAG